MTNRAAIALGSNLGDRITLMRRALEALESLGAVVGWSSLYETAPVGGPDQDRYLNAVAVVDTSLPPEEILAHLHRIEAAAGRTRAEKWGPRTLDLDLIAVADASGRPVTSVGELELPHPRAHERRFVLAPLCEVWPEAILADRRPAAASLEGVSDQEVSLLTTDWRRPRTGAAWALVTVQFSLLGLFGVVTVLTGRLPDRLGPVEVVGAVVAGAGVAGAVWASARLGSALTPLPEPRQGTTLVAEGPYRWVRHPIYAGLILGMAGGAVLARSLPGLAVAAVVGGFLWFKAGYEETRLLAAVPGYADYRRRVRGRLFPAYRR
jgi:2-amino-4-hydroxy-6-hydroxymethyldihydropteridine diphosphokinase